MKVQKGLIILNHPTKVTNAWGDEYTSDLDPVTTYYEYRSNDRIVPPQYMQFSFSVKRKCIVNITKVI